MRPFSKKEKKEKEKRKSGKMAQRFRCPSPMNKLEAVVLDSSPSTWGKETGEYFWTAKIVSSSFSEKAPLKRQSGK